MTTSKSATTTAKKAAASAPKPTSSSTKTKSTKTETAPAKPTTDPGKDLSDEAKDVHPADADSGIEAQGGDAAFLQANRSPIIATEMEQAAVDEGRDLQKEQAKLQKQIVSDRDDEVDWTVFPRSRRGSVGELVFHGALQALGYGQSEGVGEIGPDSPKAVRAYQRDHDLPETGIVTVSLWHSVVDEMGKLVATRDDSQEDASDDREIDTFVTIGGKNIPMTDDEVRNLADNLKS